MVTVYSLPSCVQCDTTKKFLERNGIDYTEVDLSSDEAAMERVREMGYTSAPVVETPEEHWSGFRMANLTKLKK